MNGKLHGLGMIKEANKNTFSYFLWENDEHINEFSEDEIKTIKEGSEDYKNLYKDSANRDLEIISSFGNIINFGNQRFYKSI